MNPAPRPSALFSAPRIESSLRPDLAFKTSAREQTSRAVVPVPFGFDPAKPICDCRDWELVVRLLPARDPESEWYCLSDIAPCLGTVTPPRLSRHAADLWPKWEGRYRLNFSQAIALIRRYCQAGHVSQRHSRADLEHFVLQRQQKGTESESAESESNDTNATERRHFLESSEEVREN